MYPSEEASEGALPAFAAFGDLMACVLGIFVLFFVWVVSFEVTLAGDLEQARAEQKAATERLQTLEQALAGPLGAGLISFTNGTIEIRGNLLFDLNSAELRAAGAALLHEMAPPLRTYLTSRAEVLMVSGFTDDLPIRGVGARSYRDNWELSVQRAVTVVRALIDAGVPEDALFAAGFGPNHPVVPNDTEPNRAKNRRVEMAPVARPKKLAGGAPRPEPPITTDDAREAG
ncbi:MAG: OmpA family protein [Polyangiales bacterium]